MLAIVEQRPEHEEQVTEFNSRLRAGGSSMQFPVRPLQERARSEEYAIGIRSFLALEGEQVRGGYILSSHGARSKSGRLTLHLIQLPLSEGIVNPRYAVLGFLLVKDALSKGPLLYGLGMGGARQPLPRLLQTLGFGLHPVPFYFRIVHARAFLRNIQPLRTSSTRRRMLDAASSMPLLPQCVSLFHGMRSSSGLRRHARIEEVSEFGPWADELWDAVAGRFSLIAVRDAATLNYRLQPSDRRLHRIRVTLDSGICGWAVVSDSQFENHKQFGAMRVGAIVDALCLEGQEHTVIAAATDYLIQRQVDLIVSNQCTHSWASALQSNGFLEGTSNFILATAPNLGKIIDNAGGMDQVQMNRCDGDGPIHL